jgi:hypothetical protein
MAILFQHCPQHCPLIDPDRRITFQIIGEIPGDIARLQFGQKSHTTKVNAYNRDIDTGAETRGMDNRSIAAKHEDNRATLQRWISAFLAFLADIDHSDIVSLLL